MKKSAMMVGLGLEPEGEAEDYEMTEDAEATGDAVAEDEAIDTFLDPATDPETRREMFRKAVELCSKRG